LPGFSLERSRCILPEQLDPSLALEVMCFSKCLALTFTSKVNDAELPRTQKIADRFLSLLGYKDYM